MVRVIRAFSLVVAAVAAAACGTQTATTPTPVPTPAPTQAPATAIVEPPPTHAPTPVPTPAPTVPPAADLAAELLEPGVLTACLTVVGPPAAALDEEGQLVGYNVSFAEEIADRLGLDLATTEPLFDNLISTIQEHQCDLAVSSQNITSDRQELVSFVPYTESIQPVLVAAGNPEQIDQLSDLCGRAVSAVEGTTHVDLVLGLGDYANGGLNAGCTAAGQQPVDLRQFQSESHAASGLLDGDVVAYLGNPNFASEFPGQIEYSVATLPPARQGITVAKDRSTILAAVEATLGAMTADGTYRQILAKHLPNDESVVIVSILE